jgi:homoserine kinase type II
MGMIPWTFEEVREFLGLYGFRPQHLEAHALQGGADNLNLLVQFDSRKLVLRRYERTPPEEVEFELELIFFLMRHDFPTAPVHPTSAGTLSASFAGKKAALFDYLEGRQGDANSLEDGLRVATTLARLHGLTGFTSAHARTRTDPNRIRDFQACCARDPGALANAGIRDFLAELDALGQELGVRQAEMATLPQGIVHHDVNSGNVLFDAAGSLAAVLDFDESYITYALVDVAGLIHYWAGHETAPGIRLDRAAQLIAAYDGVRRLTPSERDLLPLIVVLFHAADAAYYLTCKLDQLPASQVDVGRCYSYRVFQQLRRDSAWPRLLAQRLNS